MFYERPVVRSVFSFADEIEYKYIYVYIEIEKSFISSVNKNVWHFENKYIRIIPRIICKHV